MKRKLNKELLMNTLALQSESGHEWRVFAYIIRMCKKNGWKYEVDKMNNIYVTKGEADIYPCIISHMDVVGSIVEDKTVMQIEDCLFAMNYYTMERIDLGGDDLCSVVIALHALHEYDNMKCAFYVSEEIG